MSYDIKLQSSCDHRINWARFYLESDRKTVYMDRPIASFSSFRLRINMVAVPSGEFSIKNNVVLDINKPEPVLTLKRRVRHHEPLVEVSYATLADYCPKCAGRRYIDDFSFDASGTVMTVSQEELLLQRFEKIVITKLHSNMFHDWYGSGMYNLVGRKITDLDLFRTKIVDQINKAAEKLRNIQKDLGAYGRSVHPGELLGQILGIYVEETDDPTMFLVTVSFSSQRGTPLEYSQYLSTTNYRQRVAYP